MKVPNRCNTRPAGPTTGFGHPKCYARDLLDCCDKISAEHYISKAVFDVLGGPDVTVTGLPGLAPDAVKTVSSKNLVTNVLCRRHNSVLSPLDSMAANFFDFFVSKWPLCDAEMFEKEVVTVRGLDLERWLLKVYCGVLAGNLTLSEERRTKNWTPPRDWLDVLYGPADVQYPAGLLVINGNYTARVGEINMNTNFVKATNEPAALSLAVQGIILLLAMKEYPFAGVPTKSGAVAQYRPRIFQLRRARQVRRAVLGWPDGAIVSRSIGLRPGDESV